MPRTSIILTTLLISFALSVPLRTEEVAAQGYLYQQDATAPDYGEVDMIKEYESKAVANKAFMDAARRIVKENRKAEALAHLQMATTAAEESRKHYNAGRYSIAIEDLSESTYMANYAIIHANSDNQSIRDVVIKERLILDAEREDKRKKFMIEKVCLEAETFINTAERLLLSGENALARRGVEEAKGLFESAKKSLAMKNYEVALADINEAYRLSTGAVEDIKKADGSIITFPRLVTDDHNEIFDHELRRSDTNLFFAKQVIRGGDREVSAMLKRARRLRSSATRAMRSGDSAKAIEKIRAANELLVNAIKKGSND